jgi:hypothetical protein
MVVPRRRGTRGDAAGAQPARGSPRGRRVAARGRGARDARGNRLPLHPDRRWWGVPLAQPRGRPDLPQGRHQRRGHRSRSDATGSTVASFAAPGSAARSWPPEQAPCAARWCCAASTITSPARATPSRCWPMSSRAASRTSRKCPEPCQSGSSSACREAWTRRSPRCCWRARDMTSRACSWPTGKRTRTATAPPPPTTRTHARSARKSAYRCTA